MKFSRRHSSIVYGHVSSYGLPTLTPVNKTSETLIVCNLHLQLENIVRYPTKHRFRRYRNIKVLYIHVKPKCSAIFSKIVRGIFENDQTLLNDLSYFLPSFPTPRVSPLPGWNSNSPRAARQPLRSLRPVLIFRRCEDDGRSWSVCLRVSCCQCWD